MLSHQQREQISLLSHCLTRGEQIFTLQPSQLHLHCNRSDLHSSPPPTPGLHLHGSTPPKQPTFDAGPPPPRQHHLRLPPPRKDHRSIGKTKVFLRAVQMAELDARRAEKLNNAAKAIQRQIRTHITCKHFIALLEATICLQSLCRGRLACKLYWNMKRRQLLLKFNQVCAGIRPK